LLGKKGQKSHMMLFYAAEKNRAVENLEKVLAEQLPVQRVICCTTMEAFEKRLRRPHRDVGIVLISVCDAIEMVRLYQLRPILLDMRLLLILPTRDAATVAWAHKLGPRFIAYADSSVKQIAAVLDKMLKAHRQAPPSIWDEMDVVSR
jgi:DNA-binding NarL/FixJ family response regulator